jgi:hypothetical protein
MSIDKDGSQLARMRPQIGQVAELVDTPSVNGGECENDTVHTGGLICTLNAGCQSSGGGALLDGQTITVQAGAEMQEGQLLVMRTSARKERVFRLPPGKRFGTFEIRDRKPVVTIAEAGALVEPDENSKEPSDYQCGGDDRVVLRRGCRCPSGFKSARTKDNVAICASGAVSSKSSPSDAVLPWPMGS